MAQKVSNGLDLVKGQILNVALQNLSSAPSSPVAGQVYFDTTLLSAYQWNGTAWVAFDASKLVGTIPNGALATNPLARANHTGTQTSSTISDLATVVKGYTLDSFAAPVAPVSAGSQRITNVATPSSGTDAANMNYVTSQVQSASAGIASKASVVVVATSNQSLSYGSYPTIDGVTLASGYRVLLTAQTTTSQNGAYVAGASALTRATSDANNELETGALWFVEQGTTYGKTQWVLNSPTAGTAITPGTSAIGIVQFGAANVYTNGNGLSLIGSTFAVLPVSTGGISVGAGGVSVNRTYVPNIFSATIGDGSTTAITVTHNLGTYDVIAQVYDSPTTGNLMIVDTNRASTNTVTFTFASAPATNAYRCSIFG